MGYRSEVYLGVKRGSEKKLEEVLKEHDLLSNDNDSSIIFNKSEHNFKYKTFDSVTGKESDWVDDKWLIYKGTWLKWYEGYKDVDAVTNVIDELSEDNDKGFMVALGEDGEVHSEVGVYWDYVEHRSELKIVG